MSFERCDTLGHQGIGADQTQMTRYNPEEHKATTGETMQCMGVNGVLPLPIAYNIYIGKESQDVDHAPYATIAGRINPWNWICASSSKQLKEKAGIKITPAESPTKESVCYHVIKPKEISLGIKDVQTHLKKYQIWKNDPNRSEHLILLCISRATLAGFCGLALYQYPEVVLAIFEGAIDSIDNIISNRGKRLFPNESLRNVATSVVYSGLTMFTSFERNGISPLSCVDKYPTNLPTVFVTSKIDTVVPYENTLNIAQVLADRGKNDVYLIVLPNSRHENYPLGPDRHYYAAVLHAIYRRYKLHHDPVFADVGEQFVEGCLLKPSISNQLAVGL